MVPSRRGFFNPGARTGSAVWLTAAGANRELAVDCEGIELSKSGCIRERSDSVRMTIYDSVANCNKNFRPLAVFQKDIYHEGTEKNGTLIIANYH